MKLVVIVQYQESKGTRWANKGGETYIVEDITFDQRQTIQRFGIPFLTDLLEHHMDVTEAEMADDFYCRRFVKHFCLVEDDIDIVEAGLVEEWDNPYTLTGVQKRKQWTANRFVKAEFWWGKSESGNPFEGYYEGFALGLAGERISGSYNKHYVEVAA